MLAQREDVKSDESKRRSVTEMKMLRLSLHANDEDRIRNEYTIRETARVMRFGEQRPYF